ncbi:MAG: hypothetical protein M3Y80_04480, partial [Verrucomicrobiota bacterium]|nr:hypothetical protein [Verrucomicrobiota bacterium]
KITNQGLIDANIANAGLNIRAENFNGTNFTNTGILRASNGGTLSFSGNGTFFNTGGTITAVDASTVRIGARVVVSGGTISTSGTGAIRGAGVNASGGTLSNVTSTGLVAIGDGEELSVAGAFTNNGSVTLDSTGSGSVLRFGDGSVLTGTGAVTLSNNSSNQLEGIGSGDAVTIAPTATIQGAGRISPGASGGSNMLKITNQGLINANISSAALSIRAETGTEFTNTGMLRASNGGTLRFHGSGSVTNNGGTLDVITGSIMNSDGANPFSQTSGTISLDGTMMFPQGLDLNGGNLVGNGTFTGPLRNNGGIVAPGHSPGRITINGNYTQGANGVLNIEIGGSTPGTGYDQLIVSGNAALGGTLNVSLINGYQPHMGDTFTIISPQSFSGAFAQVNAQGFGVQTNYASGSITVTITSVPDQLRNISTRLNVGTGDNALIGGFIVSGTEPKKVIIRAIGPSLQPFGIPNFLADPTLELFDGAGTSLAMNDNWRDTQQAEIEASTVAPTRDAESAIVRTLPPGNYTAVVRGKNNTTGIGLVEVYDLNLSAQSKLGNISSRGFVNTDNNVMIGGFIVGGGGGGMRVAVRAIGPTLTNFGVPGALADPTLTLVDVNGVTIRANDNWRSDQQAELIAANIQPMNDAESALIATLPAGNYTAIVRGKNNTTGVGLVEVYTLP